MKDWRTGTNIRHSLTALLRHSIYGRLAGYDDLNDADCLAVDPVMRQVVGGHSFLANCSKDRNLERRPATNCDRV